MWNFQITANINDPFWIINTKRRREKCRRCCIGPPHDGPTGRLRIHIHNTRHKEWGKLISSRRLQASKHSWSAGLEALNSECRWPSRPSNPRTWFLWWTFAWISTHTRWQQSRPKWCMEDRTRSRKLWESYPWVSCNCLQGSTELRCTSKWWFDDKSDLVASGIEIALCICAHRCTGCIKLRGRAGKWRIGEDQSKSWSFSNLQQKRTDICQ